MLPIAPLAEVVIDLVGGSQEASGLHVGHAIGVVNQAKLTLISSNKL